MADFFPLGIAIDILAAAFLAATEAGRVVGVVGLLGVILVLGGLTMAIGGLFRFTCHEDFWVFVGTPVVLTFFGGSWLRYFEKSL
jgi:membrane-bound ClpP family serine protease